jgi:hypothetical protein
MRRPPASDLVLLLATAVSSVTILGAAFALAPASTRLELAAATIRSRLGGCEPYPLFHTVWVCPGGVYLRQHGRMEYMGAVRDLQPMPRPPAFVAHRGSG